MAVPGDRSGTETLARRGIETGFWMPLAAAAMTNVNHDSHSEGDYDVIVIGGGPNGLLAACSSPARRARCSCSNATTNWAVG